MVNKRKNKQVISDVDKIFNIKKQKKYLESFLNARFKLFVVAIILGLSTICGIYYISPYSKVSQVIITGNKYLSKEQVMKIAKLNQNSIYYFIFEFNLQHDLKSSPFINQVTVTKSNSRKISLEIQEKKIIGYRYDEENPQFVFVDGSMIDITSDKLDLIANLPLISGFDTEGIEYIAKGFKDVNPSVIAIISQIRNYPVSYDQYNIQLDMLDGNYFFTSRFSLNLLNEYLSVISNITDSNYCLYANDANPVIYQAVCPWDQTSEDLEKYYVDEDGNYILDANGNKIVIPEKNEENTIKDE